MPENRNEVPPVLFPLCVVLCSTQTMFFLFFYFIFTNFQIDLLTFFKLYELTIPPMLEFGADNFVLGAAPPSSSALFLPPQSFPPTNLISNKQSLFSNSREEVLQRLGEVLLRKSLTIIDLSQRQLIAADAKLVSMALLNNLSLTILKIGFNSLADEGCQALSLALEDHPSLSELEIGFNSITDVGCVAIASAIKFNPTLKILYLSGNAIGPKGATALSQVQFLECLYLTGNQIQDEGIAALCRYRQHQRRHINTNQNHKKHSLTSPQPNPTQPNPTQPNSTHTETFQPPQ